MSQDYFFNGKSLKSVYATRELLEEGLWSWGLNINGQLGLGDTTNRSSPVQVGSDTNWSKVIGSDYSSTIALKTDGTLWSWGYNGNGTLGLGDTTNRSSPTQVGDLTDWVDIASHQAAVHAIKTDGTLWAWGYNRLTAGFGTGDENYSFLRSSPIQVGTETKWTKLVHGAGIIVKGSTLVYDNEKNVYGIVGDSFDFNYASHTQILSDSSWAQFGNGSENWFLAIKTNGTLWAWGENSEGQLGLGDIISRFSSPVQVGSDTNWSYVDAGNYGSALAIKTDGTLWTWGYNGDGNLGLGDTTNRSSPVQVGSDTNWSKVQGSDYSSTIALKTDGTLWAWGYNYYGHLGLGDTTSRSSPTQVGLSTNWSKINSSSSALTLAIKTDGTLWSWGYNGDGNLGLGDTTNRSSPVQVGTLTTWAEIGSNEGDNSFAIKTDGTLWSWGYNGNGTLGLGDTTDRSSPVQVGSDTNWSKLSSTRNGHMFASKTNGTMWVWGRAWTSTEMGTGWSTPVISYSTPIQVASSVDWTGVISMSSSYYASSFLSTDNKIYIAGYPLGDSEFAKFKKLPYSDDIKEIKSLGPAGVMFFTKGDDTLWGVGQNSIGQLGLGETVNNYWSPVQVSTHTTWDIISSTDGSVKGIKTDGTLWAWGYNGEGQLGLGDTTSRSSPTQVGALTNWSKVSSGDTSSYTAAIKTDGTLWSWGYNDYGRLGLGDTTNRSSPTQVGSATNWNNMFPNYFNMMATKYKI